MRLDPLVLLVFGLAASMSGCGSGLYCPNAKTDRLKLATETRQWLTYSSGQRIYFRDEAGNPDTLTVAQFSDTVEPYWQGDECPDRPQEVIRVRLVHSATADTIDLSGESSNQFHIVKTSLLVTYFTDTRKLFPDNQPSVYGYSARMVVGTETFADVLTVRFLPRGPSLISELYIANKIGVVAYRRQAKLWIRKT